MATIVDELVTIIGFKVDKSSESRARRSADGLRASLGKVAKTAKRVGVAMSVAFAGAAAAAAKVTIGFAETADQLAKDSQRLGLGVESLQELKFAAELSGASFGTVKVGLRTLSQGLIDATSKGTGPAADAFKELGLSLDDPAVKGRDLDGVMSIVADRFAGMEDGATKAAVAQKLFGRSGLELIPMLNGGASGLADMRAEAQALGGVISGETAASAEEFNDNMLRVRQTLGGVRNEIASKLLPIFSKAAKAVLRWVKANRTLIATRAKQFVMGLADAGRALLPILTSLAENWKTIVALLVGAKFARGVAAAIGGLKSIGLAAGGALGPIGLVAQALAALVPLAIKVNRDLSRVNATRVERGTPGFATQGQTRAESKVLEQARSMLQARELQAQQGLVSDASAEEARRGLALVEEQAASNAAARVARTQRQIDRSSDAARAKADADKISALGKRGGGGRGRGKRKSVDDLINGKLPGAAGAAAAVPQVALTVNRFEITAPITSTVNGVPGTSAREVAATISTTIQRELTATITKAAEAIQTREAR